MVLHLPRAVGHLASSPEYVSPGQHPLHQGPHTQLGGDGERLIQQGHCLGAVAWLVALEQGVAVVTSEPVGLVHHIFQWPALIESLTVLYE